MRDTIVAASNRYYNQGLAQAQVRNLSGAVISLKTSLRINKRNIKARNLLGLVYYEMGEVVEALVQWTISKNYKKEKNLADVFLKKVQSNQNKLEAYNQAIRKYNICLEYIIDENFDVALIQLKKIANGYPKFIKAQLLLALLYVRNEEYSKALKLVKKVLEIDRGNTLAAQYKAEIDDYFAYQKELKGIKKKSKEAKEDKPLNGHDVIIPRGSYKEPSNGAMNVINILLGVIIGAALVWFLIIPAKTKGMNSNENEIVKEYSEKMSLLNADIVTLTNEVEKLKTEKADLLEIKEESYVNLDLYGKILNSVAAYNRNDYVSAAKELIDIDVTTIELESARNVYNYVWGKALVPAANELYDTGVKQYNQANYEEAAKSFELARKLNDARYESAYYLGVTYVALGRMNDAKPLFEFVVAKAPNTAMGRDAAKYLK